MSDKNKLTDEQVEYISKSFTLPCTYGWVTTKPDKILTIEYDKTKTKKKTQEYLQYLEDFYNDNFKEIYREYMLYGEVLFVFDKDKKITLVKQNHE